MRDPAARAVVASPEGVLLAESADRETPPSLLRVPVPDIDPREAILLGLDDGVPLFAVDLGKRPEAAHATPIVPLREAGTMLSQSEGGLAAYLVALLNWHRTHRFCPNCGNVTEVAEAGYSRRCPHCGRHHFPRTDPVVIMSVSCGEYLLLGRRVGWEFPRFSVLAGFVSHGESAEEAVLREIHEESGILARDPQFVASQPWPFPASLMLGFAAEADRGEPTVADEELAEVHWFHITDVRGALAGQSEALQLPPPIAIARTLIERWADQQPT